MKEVTFPCKETALGLLFRGFLHNLRGPTQALLMQVELLESKCKTFSLPPKEGESIRQYLSNMKQQIFRLSSILQSIENEMDNQALGPWDLEGMIKQEVTFWEAELEFKHKVKKEINFEAPLRLKIPLYRLKAGLCSLFFALIFELTPKKGTLRIKGTRGPHPSLNFEFVPSLSLENNPYLQCALEILAPEIKAELTPGHLKLTFDPISLKPFNNKNSR